MFICDYHSCTKKALWVTNYHSYKKKYCSRECQQKDYGFFITQELPIPISPQRINKQRAIQLIEELKDTTNEKQIQQSTNRFVSWFGLANSLQVIFFSPDKDGKVRTIFTLGKTMKVNPPNTSLASIENAATNGKLIFINKRIQTPEFQRRTARFIRFSVPRNIPHFVVIMLHEYGHAIHLDPNRRKILDPFWLEWVDSQKNIPPPSAFSEFVERVADAFAASIIRIATSP